MLELVELLEIAAVKLNGIGADPQFGGFSQRNQITVTVSKNVARDNLPVTQRQDPRSGTGQGRLPKESCERQPEVKKQQVGREENQFHSVQTVGKGGHRVKANGALAREQEEGPDGAGR